MRRLHFAILALICCVGLGLVLVLITAHFFPKPIPSPGVGLPSPHPSEPLAATGLWSAPGQSWHVHLRQYTSRLLQLGGSAPQAPRILFEVDATATTLPVRHLGDQTIARLQFVSDGTAPGDLAKQTVVLEIDKGNYTVKDVLPGEDVAAQFYSFHETRCLTAQTSYPVDWIVRREDLTTVPGERDESTEDHSEIHQRLIKTREATNSAMRGGENSVKADAILITFEVRSWDIPLYTLEQTWVPGEPLWRIFRRYDQGRLDLEAIRVLDK